MKNVSIKMDEQIFGETEKILAEIKKSHNRYINEAIDNYNKVQQHPLLKKVLEEESALVKEDSMTVLKEFESLDHED